MTKVIFSFDTEDYINPGVDDYTKRICEVFDANGVTASFMMVGERARVLVERGRTDVIEALSRHEIGYHSDFHSRHPNVSEYLDACGWADGVAEFMSREHEGMSLVQQIFGRHRLWAAVPAGHSWAPQMVYGYGRLGIPIQSGSALIPPQNHPHHYLGQLHLDYNLYLDSLLLDEAWDPVPDAFETRVNGGAHYIVTCDHPTILFHSQFVDSINFNKGRNPPPEQWAPAPQRTVEEQQRALENMDLMLKYVLAHPDLEPTTYQSVVERYEERPGGSVDQRTILALAEHVGGGAFESTTLDGTSFSAADQFGLLNYTVARSDNGSLPQAAPLRRLLGPTEDGQADQETLKAPRGEVKQAAVDIERHMRSHVPTHIPMAGRTFGPSQFLMGLARYVVDMPGGAAHVRIEAAPTLPAESQMKGMKDVTWLNTWDIFPPGFAGDNLARHAKLQTWTIRPAVEAAARG